LPSRRAPIALVLASLVATAGALPAAAEAFLSKREALELAFPDADRVEHRSFALDDEQAEQVQQLSRHPLESRLVTIHTGFVGDRVTGHAVIDVHTVRTLPEAFMVVLTPEGAVRSVRILAFHEPPEFRPPDRWLRQFETSGAGEPSELLRVGARIHGIAGSTLSARAATGGVRRSLALYEVLVRTAETPVANRERSGASPGVGGS
jgi:hypothetical protein